MRARRRIAAIAQLVLHGAGAFEGTGHALGRQPFVDFFGAQPAATVQRFDRRQQGRCVEREVVAQHMDGRATPVHDSSTPLTQCMPLSQQAWRASGRPSMVSWSVSASVCTPCSWARATSVEGDRAPSEAVL